jgi:serine/threonine-protein kinase
MLRVSQLAAVVLALWAPIAFGGQEYFGAIAYSPKSGAHGWAKDHPTQAAAEKAALEACRKHADDCLPALWFKNACGALVVNPKGRYYWGWGTTQKLADREATKACRKHGKGCKVTVRACTSGAG